MTAAAQDAGTLADGKPCSHVGCLNHVTHPCEGCGRIAGRSRVATQDAELRERLTETVCRMVRDGTRVYIAGLAEQVVDVVLSELSRAGGERTQAEPGAELTVDDYERETSAEYREWRADPDSCDFGPPMEEADRLVGVVVGLRAENATLRSQLADAEAARAKAMGKPVAGFARDEEWLREVNCEVVGQAVGDTVEAIGYAMEELDRRAAIIDSQTAELSTLRAALAKAEEEAKRLRNFRANAEQVADDIGCEGLDNPGKCKCTGCRIREADWDDDDLDRKRGAR